MYTKYKYKHHTLIHVCIFEYNCEYNFEYNFLYFNQLTSKTYRFIIKIY